MSQVDTRYGEVLRTIDPVVLGARVRAARIARGWSQGDLAGDLLSTAYLSRIETGARRPTFTVLVAVAERLGLSAEEMLDGASADDLAEINLGLSYAELALENGEPLDAEHQARQFVSRAEDASLADLAERGRFLVARAMEAQGQLDAAITEFEALLEITTGVAAIRCGIALCRCYREVGDLTLATELGDRLRPVIRDGGLEHSDEAIQLAMTVALAYIERGDLSRAARICTEAVKVAEQTASPAARSAAYWNSSVVYSERGDTRSALALANRALALLGEGQDTRNLARLRLEMGRLQVELEPDDLREAIGNIETARRGLTGSSASQVEIAQCDTILARALIAAGRPGDAFEMASTAISATPTAASLGLAESTIVLGEALAQLGRRDEAITTCRSAAAILRRIHGADRWIAQAWCELADLLDGLGDMQGAHAALRCAARASGLRVHRRAGTRAPAATRD